MDSSPKPARHNQTPSQFVHISPQSLLEDSFFLAKKVWDSGFRPDYIIALWRGGTPPCVALSEYFKFRGCNAYHTAIKTASYQSFRQSREVEVKGANHIVDVVNSEDRLLLVDDVFDSGRTMEAVVNIFKKMARKNCPQIRVACVYYKPDRKMVEMVPDYYQVVSNDWIVFPHELEGIPLPEIMAGKGPVIGELMAQAQKEDAISKVEKIRRERETENGTDCENKE